MSRGGRSSWHGWTSCGSVASTLATALVTTRTTCGHDTGARLGLRVEVWLNSGPGFVSLPETRVVRVAGRLDDAGDVDIWDLRLANRGIGDPECGKGKGPTISCEAFALFGSPTWARTRDLRINSPALYRLSYRGSEPRSIASVFATRQASRKFLRRGCRGAHQQRSVRRAWPRYAGNARCLSPARGSGPPPRRLTSWCGAPRRGTRPVRTARSPTHAPCAAPAGTDRRARTGRATPSRRGGRPRCRRRRAR